MYANVYLCFQIFLDVRMDFLSSLENEVDFSFFILYFIGFVPTYKSSCFYPVKYAIYGRIH